MKKIFLFLAVIGMTAIQSCEGPEGPRGASGPESAVYETPPVNFLPASYGVFYDFPRPIFQTDHVLVYRLSGVTNSGDDVWKLLPETHFFPDGTLDFKYDYDFTQYDVNIVIDGNDLETLGNEFKLGQIFRIVVVPGYWANKSAMNVEDYHAVTAALGLDDSAIQLMTAKKK